MASLRDQELRRHVREFITPVETALRGDQTISEAMQTLRQRTIEHKVVYFYVVDENGKLLGVIATRTLLLSDPSARLTDVMNTPVLSMPQDATLFEAMEEFAIHRLLALPVVDHEGRLLGTIDARLYAEEAFDLAQSNRESDLYQLIGLRVAALRQGTPWLGFRMRMPWLLCNLLSGLICALIALYFKEVLDRIVLLAMFFPLVLTLSESISMQSMTISLQYLHGSRVPWKVMLHRAGMEWRTAMILGVVSGVIVAGASIFWGGRDVLPGAIASPAIVLAVSIIGGMSSSALMGLGLPVTLHGLKLDPRVAAGPVVLMIADVITTAVYLILATWMLL